MDQQDIFKCGEKKTKKTYAAKHISPPGAVPGGGLINIFPVVLKFDKITSVDTGFVDVSFLCLLIMG